MGSNPIRSTILNGIMSGILPKTVDEIEKFSSNIGATYYVDPETGFRILTSYFLKKRGSCCDRSCRHCPYKEKDEEKNEPGE